MTHVIRGETRDDHGLIGQPWQAGPYDGTAADALKARIKRLRNAGSGFRRIDGGIEMDRPDLSVIERVQWVDAS